MGPYDRDCVYERYTNGYLAELIDSGYSHRALTEGAHEDLDQFLESVEEIGREKGMDDGWDTAQDEFSHEITAAKREVEDMQHQLDKIAAPLLKEIAELKAKVADAERPFIAELSFFLGELLDTSPIDTEDVEAWAFQDGHNEVIRLLMLRMGELSTKATEKLQKSALDYSQPERWGDEEGL